MCLAVPMKVTSITPEGLATCKVGEGDTFVNASAMLLEEELKVGDYVIVHAGFCLRKIEPEDAEQTLKLLREIVASAKPEDWG